MLRFFTEHPETVGETYAQHLCVAFSFGSAMLAAGVACLLHGVFPFLFKKTGSDAIRRLHTQMVTHRDRTSGAPNSNIQNNSLQNSHTQAAAPTQPI